MTIYYMCLMQSFILTEIFFACNAVTILSYYVFLSSLTVSYTKRRYCKKHDHIGIKILYKV